MARPAPQTANRTPAPSAGFLRLYKALSPAARMVHRVAGLALQSIDARRASESLGRCEPPTTAPRIVVDGCVFQESGEGIARVWESVMREWSRSGFAAHVTVLDRGTTAPRFEGFNYRELPRVRERDATAQRSLLQAVCDCEHADLFVSTLYTTPQRTPSVLVVYDLTPEMLGWDLRGPMWRERIHAISRASAHICISQNTAGDLHRLYPATAEKPCDVALLGVDESYQPASRPAVEKLRLDLGLPERYFLFMGLRDEYKNAALLLDTLARHTSDPGFGVLFVGGSLEPESSVARRAGAVPIRVARRLSDDELRAAYTGASALLYLSRYEGFGLPVLEAMACGCPVICGSHSSLPEVAGDAALYLDSLDIDTLSAAMDRVLQPQMRDELVQRGFENCRRFSWERTAQQMQQAMVAAATADSAAPKLRT